MLPYPQPSIRKKAQTKQQKFFVLTSQEARDAKAQYVADKAQKVLEKEQKSHEREQRKQEKQVAAMEKLKMTEEKAKFKEKRKAESNTKKIEIQNKRGKKRKCNKSSLQDTDHNNNEHHPSMSESQNCSYCHVTYGAKEDDKKGEDWLQCVTCHSWFHESCAELFGILDDAYFTCQSCS